MSVTQFTISALGKLVLLASVLVVFLAGMVGVVYIALQGETITLPEITGKNFAESEIELAALGLKIKKRADRVSDGPPNTVLEQLPKPGETVKTGQLILVVTSKEPVGGEAVPLRKGIAETDDTETIKEMISDKPKKKTNTNTNKKKADTSRDVNAAGASNVAAGNSNAKPPDTGSSAPGKTAPPSNSKPPAANTGKPAASDQKPRTERKP